MADEKIRCFLCNHQAEVYAYNGVSTTVSCDICLKYKINRDMIGKDNKFFDKKTESIKHLLSGLSREQYEKLGTPFEIMHDEVINHPLLPGDNDYIWKINKLLSHIKKESTHYGQIITIQTTNKEYQAICYAHNMDEVNNFIRFAVDKGYLADSGKTESVMLFRGHLTIEGHDYLKDRNPESKQIFVAMQYDDDMIKLIGDIKSEIKEKTDFNLFIIGKKEHNNLIDDEMIAEINRSRALIADFSHNNYGAYYEAGYALGRGIPVIYICKDDKIKETHFDINHRNHILWLNVEDLKTKLINRINATLL